jgi:TonB family protein
MQSFSCKRFALFVSLILGLLTVASAQSPAGTPDWETLRPEGEEFSVLMPKGSKSESGKEPYHKMELNTRFYVSNSPAGPVFAVVSLSGIKSNPALYSEMQRVNSYVDAFKNLFVPKVRKGAIAKLTLVGEKTLQGNPGREYRMTLGDLSGNVHVFATRKRFYAIVYLNSKKDDSIRDEFLSSFVLPDKFAEPAPTVATQTPAGGPANAPVQPSPGSTPEGDTAANSPGDTKPEGSDPTGARPQKRRPISGGVLNGKALSLPKPELPPDARDASGTVTVQVTIDEMGNVIEAKAVSGVPVLQQAAVNAALQARFSQTLLMGEPVKVTGVILYYFGAASR